MVWLLRCCLAKSRGQRSFRQNCCRHNAVVMNCDVEVRDNIKKAIKHLRIVFPGEEDRGRHGVSVLTPIGAALVGLSEGASIEWCTPVGDRSSYTVLRVRHRALKIGRTSGPRISMRK